jgi:hypothetical protein
MRTATAALLLPIVLACSRPRSQPNEPRMTESTIEGVLAAHNDSLMALPGVVGTAIGRCGGVACIRVFVRDSAAAQRTRLGDKLDGYPLRVEVTGEFHAR